MPPCIATIGCGGCEQTRSTLARQNFTLSDAYVGFYVNPTNTAEQIVNYHAKKPWPLTMAAVDPEFAERYGVYVYPTFITVDESGVVEEITEGYDEAFFAGKGK